VSITADSI